MSELTEDELLEYLRLAFGYEDDSEKFNQAYKQIVETLKLFHSPLGRMTKYDPPEEWIKIK